MQNMARFPGPSCLLIMCTVGSVCKVDMDIAGGCTAWMYSGQVATARWPLKVMFLSSFVNMASCRKHRACKAPVKHFGGKRAGVLLTSIWHSHMC